jgi:hypothetical protein
MDNIGITKENRDSPETVILNREARMEPDDQPQLTDYSEDGVDLTLIRWMLSLTPAERLQVLEQQLNDILAIRALNAGK